MPYSRAEIEADIDANLLWILEWYESLEDVPAPHVLRTLGLDWVQLLLGNRPSLTDDAAWALVQRARNDPYAFDAANYLAGRYVLFKESMPPTLHCFASNVLLGRQDRPPAPRGRRRDGGLPLRLGLLFLIHWLHHRGEMPIGANREKQDSEALNACDLVAAAMTRSGRRMTRESLEDLCYHSAPKHAEARAVFEALGLPARIAAGVQKNPLN